MHPTVSIVMPAYNAEPYIQSAVSSVQAQTISDWELIVVDDCSTDQTAEIIRMLANNDSRIHPIFNGRNCGVVASRNMALDACKGQYIALLDADDVWHPEKLARQLKKINETKADIVYCSYAIVDQTGHKCCADFVVDEHTDFQKMLRRNEIGCSTVLLDASKGSYRFRDGFGHEDYVLWMTMLKNGCTAAGIADVLVDWRKAEGGRSFDKRKSARNRWRIYRACLGLTLWDSIKAFTGYALNGLRKYRERK